MWRLPADFWTAMEKGLQHLIRGTQEYTSPSLPLKTTFNPIQSHICAAFQEQNSIQWMNIFKGRLSHTWQQLATAHFRLKRFNLRAEEWGPKFVTAMWAHSLWISISQQ
jgi:hypothetical protein